MTPTLRDNVIASFAYNDLGRRTALTFGNGASQSYGYDPVSRLKTLTSNLTSAADDLTQTFAYNPASQIKSAVRSNDAFAFAKAAATTASAANGLNQLTTVGGVARLR